MSNCITVNGMNIAEAHRPQFWIKSHLGNYELGFNFSLQGPPDRDGKTRWANIFSARAYVSCQGTNTQDLGIAHLEKRLLVKTSPDHSIHQQITFFLSLSPGQLSGLEDMRNGQDIEFKLSIKGDGGDKDNINAVHDDWKVKIPRSDWIDRLKQANYMETILLEVSMLPKGEISDDWLDIKAHLEEAQRHFMNKEYSSCIQQCRKVLEEAGHLRFGTGNWHNRLLDQIGLNKRAAGKEKPSREDMGKEDRENAIWAALHHYTHQSNHSKSKGGESNYSRSDAKLILTLTVAFVNF